jgi:hypothetical protein
MIIGNAMVCTAVDHGGKKQNKIVWIIEGKEEQKEGGTGNEQEEQEI